MNKYYLLFMLLFASPFMASSLYVALPAQQTLSFTPDYSGCLGSLMPVGKATDKERSRFITVVQIGL